MNIGFIGLGVMGRPMAEQLMNAAIANGDGERDHSALIRTLELLAGGPR